jgi:hypothetical protein
MFFIVAVNALAGAIVYISLPIQVGLKPLAPL